MGRPWRVQRQALTAVLVIGVLATWLIPQPSAAAWISGYAEEQLFTWHRQASHTKDERHLVLHSGNAEFRVQLDDNLRRIQVNATGGSAGGLEVEIFAQRGEQLEPGVYRTVNWHDAVITRLRMGRGCQYGKGRLAIMDFALDARGDLETFWAFYQHYCEHRLDPIYGEIRIGAAQHPRTIAPSAVWFPDLYPGAPWGASTPVVVANTTDEPVRLDGSAVAGGHAGDFLLEQDGCRDRVLHPGDSCPVHVRFEPSAAGPRHARLSIPIDGGAPVTVGLDGTGIAGRTRLTIVSEPGHPHGRGDTIDYGPADAQFEAFGWTGSITVHAFAPDDAWALRFSSANNRPLEEGDYEEAVERGNQSFPGLYVQRSGSPRCFPRGRFTVLAAKFDPYEVGWEHFSAEFEHECVTEPGKLEGRIDYRIPTGDTSPPGPVETLTVAGDRTTAQLRWANPADEDHAHTVVRYLPDTNPPTLPVAGHQAYAGAGTSVTVEGLAPDRPYAFAVFTVDRAGNYGTPATAVLEAREASAPRPPPETPVVRMGGPDRIETAIAVSRERYPYRLAGIVVLARADDYADALAGTPLARGGVILLTAGEGLHPATEAEISRVLHPYGTVYLVGGEAALSAQVEDTLVANGHLVRRLAGSTRYETAIEIARELDEPKAAFLVAGTDYADALAAGAAAARVGGAVLLTLADRPHPSTMAYLESYRGERIAIGGPAARAHPEAEPVVGPTREATSVLVAERFLEEPMTVGLARRDDFADALAGSAHMGARTGAMLLTSTDRLHPDVERYLCGWDQSLRAVYVYGGTAALSARTADTIAQRGNGLGCAAASP